MNAISVVFAALVAVMPADVPPYIHQLICQEYSMGKSESAIADELNLNRNTVAAVIADCAWER